MAEGAGRLQDVFRALAAPVCRFCWDVDFRGIERLPECGPAILAPNHISFLDSAFLTVLLPRRISFVGKAEYMDSWKTKHLFPAMGMIPIDRRGGSASEGALAAAERVLARGELFGIFPEGTRSRTGKLYRGHTGAARLALRADCPVFPVGIIGTDAIQPPDAPVPRLFKACRIVIGSPVNTRRWAGKPDDRLALRSITDELMFEIRELTGQDYVDAYATKTAENLPTEVAKVRSAGEVVERAGRELVGVG